MPSPPRVVRDAAYEQIRDWITLGPLQPEEPLRDQEIAALLGLDEEPVRAALLRLAEEGLVECSPGRAPQIAGLRFDRARHLYAVGGALEALAAERAAESMPAEALDAMDATLAEMRTSAAGPAELGRLDERFHAAYYVAAGNGRLTSLLDTLTVELRLFDRVGLSDPETKVTAHVEHEEILAALHARDGARAAVAARFNWMHAWAKVENLLRRGGIARGHAGTRCICGS